MSSSAAGWVPRGVPRGGVPRGAPTVPTVSYRAPRCPQLVSISVNSGLQGRLFWSILVNSGQFGD